MHITICATNCFFTFPYSHSFYVISWSYVSAPEFCKKPFMQWFQTEKKKDWCDVIHMLKLLMHFYWYIALFFFFKPSGVKLSITCFVPRATRHARTVIKLIKFSRIGCTKNQKMFIFLRGLIGKIYWQDGDISWREFSLSACKEYFISLTRWIP